MQAILKNNIDNIKELCKQHYIIKMYAFGSSISGEFNTESDIDLLYEMDYSGFDFTLDATFDKQITHIGWGYKGPSIALAYSILSKKWTR